MKTKLSEIPVNARIMSEFTTYLQAQRFDTASNDSNLSTVRKCLGYLFLYEDSMLNFLSEKHEDYDLDKHFFPLSISFMEVKDPTIIGGWIQSIGGPSGKSEPSRRKEMLKAHARWRGFVKEKLEETDFGFTGEAFYKKEIILKNLEKISEKISVKKIFSQLSKLENQARTQKQKARQILYPSQNYKEQTSVKKWFESAKAKEEEEACLKIYQKAMSGNKLGPKEFNRFANYARFTLALEDRNRRSTYNFTNADFAARIPKWLPSEVSEEGVGSEIDKFEMLPEGFNADEPPELGLEPTCWVMVICGDQKGLKGGRPAEVVFTKRSHELCLKFKDIKTDFFEDFTGEDYFFLNSRGKLLAPLQRTPGSLLDKLGVVCDLTNPTINTFRRAAETVVQSSPKVRSQVEILQSHSAKVGVTYYDRSSQNTRAQFISQLSTVDSPKDDRDDGASDDVKKKRADEDKIERLKTIELAKKKLAQDKKNKKQRLSQKCKVQPQDREFLQNILTSEDDQLPLPCPSDGAWKKLFYRKVDAKPGDEGDKLRKIEEQMFAEVVKKDVEDELGVWSGSKEQNDLADSKISMNVKSSFRVYEKSRAKHEKCYFKF